MKKGIQNVNIITYKLKPALTKKTSQMLKVTREEKQKKKKIIEKQKAESITAKYKKNREKTSLSM